MERRSVSTTGPQAVARAGAVLAAFEAGRESWGVSALAAHLGWSKSTVFRILAALVAAGLLEQDGAQQYQLGPETLRLGALALRQNGLRRACRPALENLARETGEAASLEILQGDEVLVVDEAAGRHLVGATPGIGMRWPAHATSTGKLLLAHRAPAPSGTRRSPLRPLPACTARTITDPTALDRELAAIRQHGYAVAREELEEGYTAVAVPLRDLDETVVGALSVGAPSRRLPPPAEATLLRHLLAEAAAVSRRLGSAGEPGRA